MRDHKEQINGKRDKVIVFTASWKSELQVADVTVHPTDADWGQDQASVS